MGGGIREKFRSSLCISGGNRRQPQTPPPSPDHAAGGDEGSGGTEGPDLLSALPDDVLILILGFLPSAAAAARTSVLSHRWRLLWTQLPVLLFVYPEKPLENAGIVAARTSARSLHGRRRRARMRGLRSSHSAPADPLLRAGAALAGHAAPEIRLLAIADIAADPDDADAVLLAAAPRLTGSLVLLFRFRVLEWIGATDVDAIELPCFEKAENIELNLAYLGLALPPSGVFDRLTALRLKKVQFQGPCNLGDAVSSERCPSLQRLCVAHARGVSSIDIRSDSLINLELNTVEGLQQLTVVAPMLKHLKVTDSFIGRQPVANITVPVLESLKWVDEYDPSSVHLGNLPQLQELAILGDLKNEYPDYPFNWELLMLLQQFQKISKVHLSVCYPPVNSQYLAEVMTFLPDIEDLHFGTSTFGHAFGPYLFHVLRMSSGIRKLVLKIHGDLKGKAVCSPDCVCRQPQDSETEELHLDSLHEVEICQYRGAGHEVAFLRRLLRWASLLKKITIDFDPSITVSEEICHALFGLSKQGTCMKIYFYRDGEKVMYAPVD